MTHSPPAHGQEHRRGKHGDAEEASPELERAEVCNPDGRDAGEDQFDTLGQGPRCPGRLSAAGPRHGGLSRIQ